MRCRPIILMCAIIAAAALVVVAAVSYWQKQHSYFGLSNDDDLSSLESRIANVESAVGIQRWKFEFSLPPRHTLFAMFHAEFNGESVPEMSGTYHVVPAWPSEQTNGEIHVVFYDPSFETKLPEDSTWTLSLYARNERERKSYFSSSSSSRSVGNSFSHVSPLNSSRYEGPQSTGGGSGGRGPLEPGRDYEMWEYHATGIPSRGSNEEPFDFKYKLTVRMERLRPGEKLGRVVKVERGQ